MTLLGEIRDRLMRRKKAHQEFDATGTQAERLARSADRDPPVPKASAEAELKRPPADAPKAKRGNGDAAIVDRLTGVLDERLGRQSDQTRRLMEPVGRLPKALERLDMLERQNARALEAIAQVQQELAALGQREPAQAAPPLDPQVLEPLRAELADLRSEMLSRLQAPARDEQVHEALQALAERAGAHEAALQQLREQLQDASEAVHQAGEQRHAFTEQVSQVLETCARIQEAVGALEGRLTDETAQRGQGLEQATRRLMVVVFGAAGVSILALIVAILALL